MQDIFHVPERDNPTATRLTPQAANMLHRAPLLAIGTVDEDNRPWTSLWGGEMGFAGVVGPDLVGAASDVDARFDPVVQALLGGKGSGELVQDEGRSRMVAGLTFDLETRKRVKLFGRMVAGALTMGEDESSKDAQFKKGFVKLVLKIEQSLGNCPKYMNKKRIEPAPITPELLSDSPILTSRAIALIEKADTFFLSTANGTQDMDTNTRGGPPGFARILSNFAPGAVLIWPEYSGNRLYQSLGNLQTTPRAGLVFPDFVTGDVLYVTGDTQILVGPDAEAVIPRSSLAVRLTLTAARLVARGLPFRGTNGEPSPYNPPLRRLAAEGSLGAQISKGTDTATLVQKTVLSPSISRYRFSIAESISLSPGQWIALDFSPELDLGYSHMRDDDPASLNDDFVRTFTVSASPAFSGPSATTAPTTEFEITARLHGPVTAFLASASAHPRSLAVPLRGSGGAFELDLSASALAGVRGLVPFVAGGVGVTPLLAHLPLVRRLKTERGSEEGDDGGNDKGVVLGLRLFWAVRGADASFVIDTLESFGDVLVGGEGSHAETQIFVSGGAGLGDEQAWDLVRKLGAKVVMRRMERADLQKMYGYKGMKWYVCAGGGMRKAIVNDWLSDAAEVVSEDFDF